MLPVLTTMRVQQCKLPFQPKPRLPALPCVCVYVCVRVRVCVCVCP